MAVVLAANLIPIDDSLLGELVHLPGDFVSVPSSFKKVGNLSILH